MNSLLASSINGGFNNQQVSNGSSSSVLLSSIDFTVTDRMTNYSSSQQGKSLIKLTDTEDILCNGQNKIKNYDQNKNTIENFVGMNGNKEKSEDSIPVPKVQLFSGKISSEWIQSYKIGAGLNNLGNTCFMNTVIQCLTYCPPLANYLLHDNDHVSKCTITGFCMMCLLQRHMKRAIGKTGEIIKPLDIYQRLKLIAKHFQFGRQEDAHEFLRYVVDHLWKACLTQVNGVKLDSASKETTVINRIFGGYHRSQVICLRCKKKSNTFDHFMDFILDIKQNVMSLEKALEKFIQPELLQQENSYKCPKCKMKVEAQKRFTVYQAPVVATFQLKRFDYNRSFGGKITKQITYPEKLNLRPYMSEPQGDPVWYRLNAVLVHSGASCNSGHYYCYVRNSNNFWYIMDDSRVHQVSLNQVLNQSAYVLFYIKMEDSERAPLKKCLDNKNAFMKGTISNSPFRKVSEVNNVIKPMPLSDNNSPFSSCKPHSSPNSVKKFSSFSSPNREKISFGFRANATSTELSSPKNKSTSSEPVSVKQSGLVPYIEDSSESSDASESYPSQNKLNSVASTNSKHLSKVGSPDSYKRSPQLEIKTKLSKSVFSTPSYSPVNNTALIVSATDSWIVMDPPQTPVSSSSSSTGVNSTTDWDVIEASDLALNSSSTVKENKNSSIKESLSSPKLSMPEISPSKHLGKANEGCRDLSLDGQMSNGHEISPSAENYDFRKIPKNKICFPKDEEINNPFKRKYSDSNTKISKDSPHSEHNESRYSPLPKKVKHAENSPFLKSETDLRNSESKSKSNDSSSLSSAVQQRHYNSNCDNNSRTFNGVLHFDKSAASPSKFSNNSPMENNKNNHSRGNQDKSFSQYSNKGNNSFLFGTEVPTWRGENHYRPSLNSGHEVRRNFDDYDNELDRGRIRKSKVKDHYHHHSYQKNPFQKYGDGYGRYNNRKFYNPQHFKKYDSQRKWNSNHRNGYQRNSHHNQHRRY